MLALVAIAAYFGNRAMNQPAPVSPILATKTATVTMGTFRGPSGSAGCRRPFSSRISPAPSMRGPDSNREMILLMTATPGSWVKKGTMVASIDSQSMQDHVDDLGDTIQAASADVKSGEPSKDRMGEVAADVARDEVRGEKAASITKRRKYGRTSSGSF